MFPWPLAFAQAWLAGWHCVQCLLISHFTRATHAVARSRLGGGLACSKAAEVGIALPHQALPLHSTGAGHSGSEASYVLQPFSSLTSAQDAQGGAGHSGSEASCVLQPFSFLTSAWDAPGGCRIAVEFLGDDIFKGDPEWRGKSFLPQLGTVVGTGSSRRSGLPLSAASVV